MSSYPQISESSRVANMLKVTQAPVQLNGQRFRATLIAPESGRHAIDMISAQQWVDRHPLCYQDSLKKIIQGLEYIPQNRFEDLLGKTTAIYKDNLKPGEKVKLLMEPCKSTNWVPLLALTLDPDLSFHCTSKLGIKNGNGFSETLEKQEMNLKNIIQSLSSFPPIPKQDQLIAKYERIIANISYSLAIFDDASYSGMQLHDHIAGIIDALIGFSNRMRDFISEREGLYSLGLPFVKLPRILVVCPVLSTTAQTRIAPLLANRHVKVKFYHTQEVPCIQDTFDSKVVEDVKELWGKNSPKLPIVYFDHKCANSVSFPEQIIKGSICSGSQVDSSTLFKEWPFLTQYQPPYKFSNSCMLHEDISSESKTSPSTVTEALSPSPMKMPEEETILKPIKGVTPDRFKRRIEETQSKEAPAPLSLHMADTHHFISTIPHKQVKRDAYAKALHDNRMYDSWCFDKRIQEIDEEDNPEENNPPSAPWHSYNGLSLFSEKKHIKKTRE